jgi:nucleotide-binding universal stress UspA family protein
MRSVRAAWQCPPASIVVGVDFGAASARAVSIATRIATAFHAHLRAVHAERFEPPAYFTPEQIARLEAERRMSQGAAAAHLATFVGASANEVEPAIVDAPPVDALLDATASADLIVLGTHGRRGPARWWLGSVTERVLREATIPALVVRAATTPLADVFARVLLTGAGEADAGARHCADALAGIETGRVITGAAPAACDPQTLADASLIVVPIPVSGWRLNDDISRLLVTCDRPVLFVPAR